MTRFTHLALPGIILSMSFALVACGSSDADDSGSGGSDCVPTTVSSGTGGDTSSTTVATTSSSSSTGSGGSTGSGQETEDPTIGGLTTGNENNTFDHFNDPGSNGAKDPFELLKERAEEGPPEIRTRLHSCSKIPYATLGTMLTSLGVNINATAGAGKVPTAGDLYRNGGDAMGIAHFDAREGEAQFHTTAGATKTFDIFVQAAPEIIANLQNMPICQLNGTGYPVFDPMDNSCVPEALSCIMGRPSTEEDVILCNLLIAQAKDDTDLITKKNIAVATFLAAAHTCE